MAREPREVWEKRVARWRESGLTAKEFALELGVNANTLGHWAWRLGQGEADRTTEPKRARPKASPPSVAFVEVIPASPRDEQTRRAPVQAGAPFELVLGGGRTLRVPADFEAESLRRLLTLLEAA
jgi:hypothetical protein